MFITALCNFCEFEKNVLNRKFAPRVKCFISVLLAEYVDFPAHIWDLLMGDLLSAKGLFCSTVKVVLIYHSSWVVTLAFIEVNIILACGSGLYRQTTKVKKEMNIAHF